VTTSSSARSFDGVPIPFDVAGSGEPTLLFVHGWAFDRRLWEHEVRRLAPRQRVVTLDLAGHGESGGERKDWTIAAFGEDVKAVAEAVGSTQLVLIGHSMGGPVVLEAARRLPGRVMGVVLVDILLDVEQRTPPDQIDAMVQQLEADYRATATHMANEYMLVPATPPSVRERVIAHATAMPPDVSIALLRAVWSYDARPALAEIGAPIRAVSSDRYPTNLATNRKHMPGYEAVLVPGTGHYPMLEDPSRFAAALDGVLSRLTSA
jgi:pimeloyl-ACP methyl ester carboxylesterase